MSPYKPATVEGIKSTGLVYVKDASTSTITKIATAADLQVGLTNLPSSLTTIGLAYFNAGLSGSLTRLVDGTSYLIAGSNITITSASNGSITIAGSGGSGDVTGPASSTQYAIALFNDTTGKVLRNSQLTTNGSDSLWIASSLNISGSTTLGDNSSDAVTINGTTTFVGAGITTTFAGDVAVNGGDITTTSSTFNLVNTNATILNLGGAATTIEIGAATGTTSVNNSLTVDGSATLGDAAADVITVNGTTTFVGAGITTTFAGDVAVNGGDITTTAATFNLVNAATTINLGSTIVTRTINIGSNATNIQTINIGNGAAANIITVGSTTGAASLTLQAGTGNFSLTGAASTTYTIGPTNRTGTISIGNSTATNTIEIGDGSIATGAQQTIDLCAANITNNASAYRVINIGTGTGGGASGVANFLTQNRVLVGKVQSGTGFTAVAIQGDYIWIGKDGTTNPTSSLIGFFGATPVAKQTVASDTLANLYTALRNYGLIT